MQAEPRKHASQHTPPRMMLEEASELKLGHERRVCARDRNRRPATVVAKADVRASAREDDRLSPFDRDARSA